MVESENYVLIGQKSKHLIEWKKYLQGKEMKDREMI